MLEKVPKLPDAQCAWLVLALCAVPRANHLLRTVPPSVSAGYAAAHDDLLWQTLLELLRGRSRATLSTSHWLAPWQRVLPG